jgi:hypothetical protein
MAAMKESPGSPGAYIGIYKNFYTILEYLMTGERLPCLTKVLQNEVGVTILQQIVADLKKTAPRQSLLLKNLTTGEQLSATKRLDPISETDPDIAERIAERLYTKRNDALHSKKTYKSVPLDHNIRPGMHEAASLDTDIALIQPIAEAIINKLGTND